MSERKKVSWPDRSSLVLAPPGAERDPSALARCLRASACSHVFVVSSVLRLLVDDLAAAPLPALSYVVQCGEALDGPLVERFYARVAGADLANVYGPTEASMTAWVAPRTFRSAADVVLVGTPVKNAFVVVLRAGSLDAAPPGEAGDIDGDPTEEPNAEAVTIFTETDKPWLRYGSLDPILARTRLRPALAELNIEPNEDQAFLDELCYRSEHEEAKGLAPRVEKMPWYARDTFGDRLPRDVAVEF